MAIEAGRLLNQRYRLIRPVGQGSQASVWVAEHLALQTHVAVKLIDPELAKKESARERFRREATAAAQLRSAHVVQILDHGIDGDQPFIVMELLDGEDLFERLAHRGRLTLRETSKIVTQVARALSRAHAANIVHRDLKPENVFLCPNEDDEVVKVLDFGVAKVQDAARVTMQKTNVGTLIGTPHYMSPEQVKGIGDIDCRTDLWALGVIGFQCVTGELPFDSEGVGDLLIKISMGEIPVPSKVYPGVPAVFDVWFAKACERDPAKRFQSAREVAVALAAAVNQAEGGTARAPTMRPPAAALPGAAGALPAPPRAPGDIAAPEIEEFFEEADLFDEDEDDRPTRMKQVEPAPSAKPASKPTPAAGAPPRPKAGVPPPRPSAPSSTPSAEAPAAPATAVVVPPGEGHEIVDFDETIPVTDNRPSHIGFPLLVRASGPGAPAPPSSNALAPLSEPPRTPAPPSPPSRQAQAVIAPVILTPPRPVAMADAAPVSAVPRHQAAPVRATTAPVEVETPSRIGTAFTEPPPELDGSSKRRRLVRWLVAGLLIGGGAITWMVVRSQLDVGGSASGTPSVLPTVTAAPAPTPTPVTPTPTATTTATAIDPGKVTRPTKPPTTHVRGPIRRLPKKPRHDDGTIVIPDPPADDSVPPAP